MCPVPWAKICSCSHVASIGIHQSIASSHWGQKSLQIDIAAVTLLELFFPCSKRIG